MTITNSYIGLFWAVIGLIMLLSQLAEAVYPNKAPRMDQCVGKSKATCKKKKPCVWNESGAPDCFETKYFKLAPKNKDPLDIVIRFFTFSYGVHLSEGTNQQTHVVHSVAECAKLCLSSTGTSGIPCLSFDYYPHEDYYNYTGAPHFETPNSGYCLLSSSNKDTARLRNSDMGWTDSELFYKSHFTYRPFSGEEGYYELRDSRGGQIATMLEYNKGIDFNAVNLWPRSRWGLMYLSTPIEVATGYLCTEPDDAPDNSPIINPADGSSVEFSEDASVRFTGAYTPVDWDQHCVGRMTKPEAAAVCQESGGSLCTQLELRTSRQVKLGCNIDNYGIWMASSAPKDLNKVTQFVRCCSRFSVLNICPFFSKNQMDFCGNLKTETQCIQQGSGTAKQASMGYGRLREYYRRGCADGTLPCNGMLKNWSTRDACLWCLRPGESEGGSGECRAGNDYGVCANASPDMQKLFALKIKAQCNSQIVCRIATRYPEKGLYFDAITLSPTTGSPTIPTNAPTSNSPVTIPSRSPTKKPTKPTRRPTTAKPTTGKPTKAPTKNPTSAPSQAPSNAPATPQPSQNPTTKPSKSPTGATSSPTSSQPSKAPVTSQPSESPSTSRPSISPTETTSSPTDAINR